MVVSEDAGMESLVVSAVTHDKDQARITLRKVQDRPGVAANIFAPISEAGIVVDMIIQNIRPEGQTDLTFTVPKKTSFQLPWRSKKRWQKKLEQKMFWVIRTSLRFLLWASG